MTDPNVLLHEFGVNCGDHAETRTMAVVVSEDETVGKMVRRLLTRDVSRMITTTHPDGSKELGWKNYQVPDGEKWLTIRLPIEAD